MPVDGVKLSDLADASLSCAVSFSKEPIYNEIIRNMNNIRLFKDILLFAHVENKGSTDNITRLAAGVIEAISGADLEGAYIIYREGLEEPVIRLSNHSNQKIGKDTRMKMLWKYFININVTKSNLCCACLFLLFIFISAQFATGILHNLSHMKNQEAAGNFHPPRHLQQPHPQQMQVRVILLLPVIFV